MNLINKKILITGAYGFVGSNIYKKLNRRNKTFLLGNKKKYNKKNELNFKNLTKKNLFQILYFIVLEVEQLEKLNTTKLNLMKTIIFQQKIYLIIV